MHACDSFPLFRASEIRKEKILQFYKLIDYQIKNLDKEI